MPRTANRRKPKAGLEVVRVALDDLTPDPENPRLHGARNVDAITASLLEHGQVVPILVQKRSNIIIHGNATAATLREIGRSEVDAVFIDCDDTERRQLAVRMNRTAELAAWDPGVLGAFLVAERESAGAGWDPGAFGFNADEWEAYEDSFLEVGSDGFDMPTDDSDRDESEERFISFSFGGYSGRVSAAVYRAFASKYEEVKRDTGEVILDAVLCAWMGVDNE